MSIFKKIVFYNHGHLGDTFLVKPFVKEIISLLKPIETAFANEYPEEYVKDIVDNHIHINSLSQQNNLSHEVINDTLFFNTWFGICHRSEISNKQNTSNDGILYNFNLLRYCFGQTLNLIDNQLSLEFMTGTDTSYIPNETLINFDVSVIPYIYETNIVKILIYNQAATSGQADYKDYSSQIEDLFNINNNIVIYTSATTNTNSDKIVNLNNYCLYPDLLKIAKIAKFCNIIAGPCNAPLISSWNKYTLLKDIKYIIINSHAVDVHGTVRSHNDVGNCIFSESVKSNTTIVNNVDNLFKSIKSII